jgi:hypothetical protein
MRANNALKTDLRMFFVEVDELAIHIQTGTELIISAVADGLMRTPAQRIKPTKVADGLGMLAKPGRKKLTDAEVKRRIGGMLKIRDEATKTR